MPGADDLQIKGQYESACLVSTVFAWLAIFVIMLSARFISPGFAGGRVLDKINPNTDPLQSLIRLPSIGPSRAELIMEYRSGEKRFDRASDLENIRGIGPKTVDKIGPWLYFNDSDDN